MNSLKPFPSTFCQFNQPMLSVQKIVPVYCPHDIIVHIQSYLTVDSWRSWRVTTKQAYQDVEQLVAAYWLLFPKLIRFNRNSLWLEFLSQVYSCQNCSEYDVGSADAETLQLCDSCFSLEQDVLTCEVCQRPFFSDSGEQCTECDEFYCETCHQDYLQFCLTCDSLFCDSCLTEHLDE